MKNDNPIEKLSIIVYDHHFDRVHFALVLASGSSAIGKPTTVFFTMGACNALIETMTNGSPGWSDMPLSDEPGVGSDRNSYYQNNGIATLEELFDACKAFKVKFMVCEMGLKAKKFEKHSLRTDVDIETGGVVSFINDASKNGSIVFI